MQKVTSEQLSRREAVRVTGGALIVTGLGGCAATASSNQAAASKQPHFEFGSFSTMPTTDLASSGIAVTFSSDKKIAAIILDDGTLALASNSATTNKSTILSAQITTTIPDNEGIVGYLASIRGVIAKSRYSSANLVVTLAGTTKCIDWTYGEEFNETFEIPVFAILRRPSKEQQETLPALPPFFLTIAMIVGRDDPSEYVTLSVDTIDIGVQL